MALILLVDDDPLVADIVSATLEPMGYTVGVLGDGRAALEVVEFKRPVLVILDCSMPVVPGLEVLRRIRSSSTAFAIPVLMLTARGSTPDHNIAMRAGASDYMRKPFDPDHLTATVDALILDNRHGHRGVAQRRG